MPNAVSRGCDYAWNATKSFANKLDKNLPSFITKPDNTLAIVVGGAKGRDALVKSAVAIAETVEEVLALTDASEAARETTGNVIEGLKFSRVVFGFFQVFTGAIPKLYLSAKKSVECFAKLFKPVENPQKEDRFETILKLAKEVSEFFANLAYLGAFGVSGPIGCAEQLSKHKFSGVTHLLVKQFDLFRMINAGCKSFGSGLTLGTESHHFGRGGSYVVENDKDRARYKRLFGYEKTIGDSLTDREKFIAHHDTIDRAQRALLDKGSQFSGIFIKIAKIPAPIGLKLGINLFSSGIGIYNVWVDALAAIADKKELDNYRKGRAGGL